MDRSVEVERWFLDSIEHIITLFCALCLIPSRITRSWVSSCSLLTSHQVVLLNPFLFTRLEWSVQRRSHHTVNVRAPDIIFINENWKDRRNKAPHKFFVKDIGPSIFPFGAHRWRGYLDSGNWPIYYPHTYCLNREEVSLNSIVLMKTYCTCEYRTLAFLNFINSLWVVIIHFLVLLAQTPREFIRPHT